VKGRTRRRLWRISISYSGRKKLPPSSTRFCISPVKKKTRRGNLNKQIKEIKERMSVPGGRDTEKTKRAMTYRPSRKRKERKTFLGKRPQAKRKEISTRGRKKAASRSGKKRTIRCDAGDPGGGSDLQASPRARGEKTARAQVLKEVGEARKKNFVPTERKLLMGSTARYERTFKGRIRLRRKGAPKQARISRPHEKRGGLLSIQEKP